MVVETKLPTAYKVTGCIGAILSSSVVKGSSFNGQDVLVTLKEGSVLFVDCLSGTVLQKFVIVEEDQDKSVSSFATSKTCLFTALSNNLIECREVEAGSLLRSWKGHNSPVLCMDHQEEALLLATGSADHSVRVWHSAQGYCTHNFKGVHGGVVSVVKFHPDPSKLELFSASEDGSVAQWDLKESKIKRTFKTHVSAVRCLDISPDGQLMLVAGRDQIISIWQLSSGKLLKTIPCTEAIESIQFISDDQFISAGERGIVRVWDVQRAACLRQSAKLTSGEHTLVSLVQRGATLILSTSDLQLVTVDAGSLKLLSFLAGSFGEVTDLAFLQSGSLVVSTNDPVLKVFDSRASLACHPLMGHSDAILSVATWKDWLVSGSRDNTARLWRRADDANWSCVATLSGHTDAVSAVCIGAPKGAALPIVATASADSTVKVWDVAEENQVHSRWTIKAHDKDINSLTFTPNMKMLITASQDKTAKVWKLDDGAQAGCLKGHRRGVWSVRCSPVEQVIATGSGDQTIKLWSASTFECLKTFEGHSNSVLRVAFIRQGTELVSTGSDGLVKVWDIKTNQCTRTYDEHIDRIWTLAFAEEGKLMVTGDASGTINVWQDATEEETSLAQAQQEQLVLKEQDLSNMLLRKDFKNAIVLAVELEQPFRLFNLFNEYTKGNAKEEASAKLAALLTTIPADKLDRILAYVKDWNTSFKRAPLAQAVLNAVLCLPGSKDLPSLQDCCKAVLPYTERHFEHIQDMMSNAFLVDFVLAHMDNYMIE